MFFTWTNFESKTIWRILLRFENLELLFCVRWFWSSHRSGNESIGGLERRLRWWVVVDIRVLSGVYPSQIISWLTNKYGLNQDHCSWQHCLNKREIFQEHLQRDILFSWVFWCLMCDRDGQIVSSWQRAETEEGEWQIQFKFFRSTISSSRFDHFYVRKIFSFSLFRTLLHFIKESSFSFQFTLSSTVVSSWIFHCK